MKTTFKETLLPKMLDEASIYYMLRKLHDLFVYILIFAAPVNTKELFKKHKYSLWEDFTHKHIEHIEDCIQCLNNE